MMSTSEWNNFQDCNQFLSAVEQNGITSKSLNKVPYGSTAIRMLGLIRSQGQEGFELIKNSGTLWFMTVVALREAFSVKKAIAKSNKLKD
jgi:hypothetical protein